MNKRTMKGFWFTVESVIACTVIAVFLIFILRAYVIPPPGSDITDMSYNTLKSLDDRGVLRNYAVSYDYPGLDDEVGLRGFGHAVNICGLGGECRGPEANSTDVWVGSFFIAGNGQYGPREVRLLVWREG